MTFDVDEAIEYFKDVYYETLTPKNFTEAGQAIISGEMNIEKSCKYPLVLNDTLIINSFDTSDVEWIKKSQFNGEIFIRFSTFDNLDVFKNVVSDKHGDRRVKIYSCDVGKLDGNNTFEKLNVEQTSIKTLDIGSFSRLNISSCEIENLVNSNKSSTRDFYISASKVNKSELTDTQFNIFELSRTTWPIDRSKKILSLKITDDKALTDFSFLPHNVSFIEVIMCQNIVTFDGLLESHRKKRMSLTGTCPNRKLLLPFSLEIMFHDFVVHGRNISDEYNDFLKNDAIYDYASFLLDLGLDENAVSI